MSSLARTNTGASARTVWLSRIPGPLLLGALAHVTHNQSTQEGQHESIGTVYLSHNAFHPFPLQFPFIGF
jgi:hypothetical protein